jgi:hypothetical protein
MEIIEFTVEQIKKYDGIIFELRNLSSNCDGSIKLSFIHNAYKSYQDNFLEYCKRYYNYTYNSRNDSYIFYWNEKK